MEKDSATRGALRGETKQGLFKRWWKGSIFKNCSKTRT
jgi:hypothetical protein